jgi:hypothetical protein
MRMLRNDFLDAGHGSQREAATGLRCGLMKQPAERLRRIE